MTEYCVYCGEKSWEEGKGCEIADCSSNYRSPEPLPPARPAYVVFDTETSGLMDFKLPADDPSQPRLAAASFITTDAFGNELSRVKHFVKPEGWEMTDEATAINGLTTEFLTENGIPVGEVLDAYEFFITMGLTVAAYNAQFDCKMMRSEFRRLERDDLFEQTRNTCLMRASRTLKDVGFTSKGFPKLKAVCDFFGYGEFEEHDVMADAAAARFLLQQLIQIGKLIPPKVHYAKKESA